MCGCFQCSVELYWLSKYRNDRISGFNLSYVIIFTQTYSSMKYTLLLLLSTLCLQHTQAVPQTSEVVHPVRIHNTRSKSDLSTQLKDNDHEDSVSFSFNSKQEGDMVVDLTKHHMHPTPLLLRTYQDDGTPTHKYHEPTRCHYSGTVNKKRESHAFIST